MRITKVGEFGLIRRLQRKIITDASVVKGSGDDCAVLRLDKRRYQLFTCDMLVEAVDFRPREKPQLIGRKAVAVSVSDIAACGGRPRYLLISVGLPLKTDLAYAEGIFQGALGMSRKYGINLVGGDISKSDKLVIDVSMLGEVKKSRLVLRSGAKKGDFIFVTGALGGSIKGRHLRFAPRLPEAGFLTQNFKINAMIDISDGLIQDLGHILEQSNCGALIYEELVPLSPQADGLADALYSGEDFELLFSLSSREAKRLMALKNNFYKFIGQIIPQEYGLLLADDSGRIRQPRAQGYRHF
jgi:thiamine-monophosphate kinase